MAGCLNPMPLDSAHEGCAVSENLLTLEGQTRFLCLLSQMKVGGVAWFAPPCNSWIVSSQSFYGRNAEHPEGTNPACREYNMLADWLALALRACIALGIYFVVENPMSSYLFSYKALSCAFLELQAHRVTVALGKIGHNTLKPLVLMGTAPWLNPLADAVSAGSTDGLSNLSFRVHNGWTGKSGQMDDSRVYPKEFCIFVAKLHQKHLQNVASSATSSGERPRKIRAKWLRELLRDELAD